MRPAPDGRRTGPQVADDTLPCPVGEYCNTRNGVEAVAKRAESGAIGVKKALGVFIAGVVVATLVAFAYIKFVQLNALLMIRVFEGLTVFGLLGTGGFLFLRGAPPRADEATATLLTLVPAASRPVAVVQGGTSPTIQAQSSAASSWPPPPGSPSSTTRSATASATLPK